MNIFKGKIVSFTSPRDSGIGYLNIKDSATELVFSIPCEKTSTIRALESCFGNVIGSDRRVSKAGGHTFQEIFWFYDQDGRFLKGFVPVNQAPKEIADFYNFEREGGHNINLRKIVRMRI
jgi:uncharacterized protein YPO0396